MAPPEDGSRRYYVLFTVRMGRPTTTGAMPHCAGANTVTPESQKAGGVASSPEAHVINIDPLLGGRAHRFGEWALWLMLHPVITYLASLHLLREMPTEVLKNTDTIIELWRPFDARIWPRATST